MSSYISDNTKKITIRSFREKKEKGEPIAMLTAYDYPVARALDQHMRSDDLKVGRFVTARENLRKLAEAGPGVGMALTPIPGTLGTWTRPRGDDPQTPTPPPLPPGDR